MGFHIALNVFYPFFFYFHFPNLCLRQLYKMHGQWIEQASKPSQQAIVKALLGARDAMLGIRFHMHQMGEAAGVPVCLFFKWILVCLHVVGLLLMVFREL
jgi:hypothetical protein